MAHVKLNAFNPTCEKYLHYYHNFPDISIF